MKKYLAVFNITTLIVFLISLVSCIVCFYYQYTLYFDFLIMSLVIYFSLSLTLKEAFKIRERALQYLSLFKASLQSVFYSIQNSKLEEEDKLAFRLIAIDFTDSLCDHLLSKVENDSSKVHKAAEQVALFVNKHHKQLKNSLAHKILLFLFRLNESVEFFTGYKATPNA